MRKLMIPLFGLALALALVGSVRSVVAAPSLATMELSANLKGGAEEVPNPGDPDGMGTSTVTLNTDSGQVSFTINVSNITLPAAAAHIHEGAKGVAGGVVVPLTAPDANGTANGSAAVDAALMQRMMDNPAGFYVNVHTTDFPGGAVRGQLAAAGGAGAPAMMPATGASDGVTTLIFGLALLALLAGIGLNWNGRRHINAR
ncbi:MAG TPA: CHRD domain-containing protein [Herpetosiphonaceae bacterium]|nr:CHRD domain-containing protein [Herpetosiphonaceae bacterium]